MKTSEQIEHAKSDSVLFPVASQHYMERLAYQRLKKCGWDFALCGLPDAVMVYKGGDWHEVSDVCDCKSFGFRQWCYHRAAVIACGGVETLRKMVSDG